MERGESLNLPQLPEALSGKGIDKNHQPTVDDWKYIQGGKPEIVLKASGKACDVIHNYINSKDSSGTGVVVPTSIHIVNNWKIKTMRYSVNNRDVDFPVALLWKFHGKPCESNGGGERYKRISVKN